MYDGGENVDGLQSYGAQDEMYSELPEKRFGIVRFGKRRTGSTKIRRGEDRLTHVRL